MTLRTVLLSLQALLANAEPDDPQDAVVAKQYKETQEIFQKTARHWANIYAGGETDYIVCTQVLNSLKCCTKEEMKQNQLEPEMLKN